MFKDILLELDTKLVEYDVSNKSLIKDRLLKINEVYLYDLIVSKYALENYGQKTILKRESKL